MKELTNAPNLNFADFTAAVEQFTYLHETRQIDSGQKIYRELIPQKTPGPGQQYAFEVDLDKCTGCKACVTACHNENGLEEDETWRSVGFIQGGTSANPVIQHITTACHHCADPACMTGCPTKAYTKDETTGIVKHLDDQCFGCQYCILKCPYDVPKYNKKKGIVHKCDMCIGRLSAGQPPACVRACPNGAIRIVLVERNEVRKNFKEFVNVPDAPASNYTYPTTRYTTKKQFPRNMVSADYLIVSPEHSHPPLVVMLVLTQLSVGTFGAQILLKKLMNAELNHLLFPFHAWIALGAGLLALAASVFHLGRPLYAFRAVLGLKTSWLSREILAFGVFASLAVIYVLGLRSEVMSYAVFLTGLIGVLCSVMVYKDTRRPFWDNHGTTFKFLITTALLGLATSLGLSVMYTSIRQPEDVSSLMFSFGRLFVMGIAGLSVVKMGWEAMIFRFLKKDDGNFFKKTAVLMTRPLKKYTLARFAAGICGGMILPLLIFAVEPNSPQASLRLAGYSFVMLVILIVAEMLERYLFFRAVVSLKMPGGIVGK
ncbi:MAG TPA: DmsC/YnfH family molybdoenzyme membrane anchor subunit [Candidatus Omnitrophota bacterium]|nr:DmsC/YnfH family molybdoenzyme membrane anchor subunit [Candidatus Omnitrophota bacterium]